MPGGRAPPFPLCYPERVEEPKNMSFIPLRAAKTLFFWFSLFVFAERRIHIDEKNTGYTIERADTGGGATWDFCGRLGGKRTGSGHARPGHR